MSINLFMGYILQHLIGYCAIVFPDDKKRQPSFYSLILDRYAKFSTLSITKKFFSLANLINNTFASTNIDNRLKHSLKVA